MAEIGPDFCMMKPVAKPKAFSDVRFTEAEWTAATKAGPVKMWRSGALEALRYAKGLYEVESVKQEVEVRVGGLTVDALDRTALIIMASQMGKPIRKKSITMAALRQHVQSLVDGISVTDTEEEIPEDDDEAEE